MNKQYNINIWIYYFIAVIALMGCGPGWCQAPSEPAVDEATREIYRPVREKVEKELMGEAGEKGDIEDDTVVPESGKLIIEKTGDDRVSGGTN